MNDAVPGNGGHHHDLVRIPDAHVDPAGRPVNHQLLAQFLGAVLKGCDTCAEATLALLAADSVTVARLVELACVSTRGYFGGLPDTITNNRHAQRAGGGVPGARALRARRCGQRQCGVI